MNLRLRKDEFVFGKINESLEKNEEKLIERKKKRVYATKKF